MYNDGTVLLDKMVVKLRGYVCQNMAWPPRAGQAGGSLDEVVVEAGSTVDHAGRISS